MALTLGHKLDANTLALWRFDETTGGAGLIDATGRYSVPSNGTNPPAVGRVDGARTVSAANGFIGTPGGPSDPSLAAALAGLWTYEAWAWVDPSVTGSSFPGPGGGYGVLAQLHDSINDVLFLGLGPTGQFVTFSTQTAELTLGGNWSNLPRGTWHHYAFRATPTGGGKATIDYFVDGVKNATVLNYTIPTAAAVAPYWTVGCETNNFNTFAGRLDDSRFSKVARTDAEIAESYWRGLLDISPGPTQAPFRQSRTPYQDYHRQLSPTALLQPKGAAFEAAQGAAKDAMFDRCLQAVKAKYPSVAPGDALAAIGADRMMPRGGSETDAAYAARLLNAWNTWPWAGTAYGLLQAFWSTGYRNVVLAQVRGGKQFTLDNGGINLLKWSNAFANWTGGFAFSTLTSNALAAPDGTTTASKLVEGANNNQHYFSSEPFAVTAGTTYSLDIYAKAGGRQLVIAWTNGFPAATFDLTLGTIVDVSAGGVGSITSVGGGWYRCTMTFTAATTGSFAYRILLSQNGSASSAYLGDGASGVYLWMAQGEPGTLAGTLAATIGTAKPTALAAGSLLTSTMASGIWETDPLSSYSPANQSFWSKFDVLFPLPLMPPSWGWSAGIPSSSSAEANFIRALIQAWKPAHATCDRIVIHQQGKLWGYPATQLWGSSGALWGGSANTVWTP